MKPELVNSNERNQSIPTTLVRLVLRFCTKAHPPKCRRRSAAQAGWVAGTVTLMRAGRVGSSSSATSEPSAESDREQASASSRLRLPTKFSNTLLEKSPCLHTAKYHNWHEEGIFKLNEHKQCTHGAKRIGSVGTDPSQSTSSMETRSGALPSVCRRDGIDCC